MINQEQLTYITTHYGHYASWAVWAEEGQKPKSNVGDLSILDIGINPLLLEVLRTDIVMVGLNISRPIDIIFGNFHDGKPESQDYKIRYALKNTIVWGAYMTDIIKGFKELNSGSVVSHLKDNQEFELKNVDLFRKELKDIQATNPTIIAFGNHSFNILNKHFNKEFPILKLPHYSMQISKETYREKIGELLKNIRL